MSTIDNRLPTEGTQKDILTAVEAISNHFDVTASTIPFDSNTTIKGAVDYKQDLYIPRLEQDANNDSAGSKRFNIVEHIPGANYHLPNDGGYWNIATIAGEDPDFATQIAYHETDTATYMRTKVSGTWSGWVAQVWGVKGNNESTYRSGNVNLTAYSVQSLWTVAGAQVGSLNDLVNLLNNSGNNRSFCGTVKFTANLGIGISANTWQRVFAVSQNAPNNGTYGMGMYCLFFPEDGVTPIKWATIGGMSTNNYSVLGYGDLDTKVTQINTTTNAEYRVLYSANANDTTETNAVRKGRLLFNPAATSGSVTGLSKLSILDSSNYGFVLWSYGCIDYRGRTIINNLTNQQLYLAASSESDQRIFYGVSGTYWTFKPTSNGTCRLGDTNNRWGQIYSASASISTSDRKEKKDIEPLDADDSVAFVMALNPVSYKMINGDSGRTHYGMIAQDVEEELEELGMTPMDFAGFCKDQKTTPYEAEEKGRKVLKSMPVEGEYVYGLRYEEFIAPMIKTIQTQQQEIDLLKSELAEIKALLLNK